jgi:hypothetical protein
VWGVKKNERGLMIATRSNSSENHSKYLWGEQDVELLSEDNENIIPQGFCHSNPPPICSLRNVDAIIQGTIPHNVG